MPQHEGQLLNVSPVRTRPREPDQICAEAVDLARAAAAEVAGAGQVGEHVGADADGDRVVTHLFACLDPAYRGWRWAVTLARATWGLATSCPRRPTTNGSCRWSRWLATTA